MFRRRDEDEVEYTLQPSNRNPANSGNSAFHATNQLPGQTISPPPAPTFTPNNTPYNPAAHSLAQAEAQGKNNQAAQNEEPQYNPVPAVKTAPAYQSTADNAVAKEIKTEPKTTTPKANPAMNTFVPSAIRASSSSSQSQSAQAQQQPQAAQNIAQPKQPLKVDNVGLETERRLTVGYGISLEGKVSDCDKLVIYGNVNAELNNVKALQISDSGCFKGAAEIDYAEISGLFEGEIKVRKNIIISSTGRVSGKITYSSIEIKPGGKFTGEIIEDKNQDSSAQSGNNANNNSSANESSGQNSGGEGFNLFPEQKTDRAA